MRALQDVSFDVERGSIHAIMGENGAGKGTLMQIIAGAQRPDSGTLEFDGPEVHFAKSGRGASGRHRSRNGVLFDVLLRVLRIFMPYVPSGTFFPRLSCRAPETTPGEASEIPRCYGLYGTLHDARADARIGGTRRR